MDLVDLKGSLLRDVSRAPIGEVREVLLSPDTFAPRWLLVAVTDGTTVQTVLVPAAAASEVAPGELLVPYPRAMILEASHTEGAALSESDAVRLMRHYGFTAWTDPGR